MDNSKFDRLKALQPEIQGAVKCTSTEVVHSFSDILHETERFVRPHINAIPKTFVSINYGTQIRWR